MKGKLVLLLFALPFAGVGLWAGYSIGANLYDAWRMTGWATVTARLERAGYESHSGDDSTTYEAYASYRYQVFGATYTGNRVGLSGGADNIGDYQVDTGRRLANLLANGDPVTVYYDPANPADSIIDRDVRWGMIGFKSIFLLVFGGVGFGLMFAAIKLRPDPDADDPAFADTPWLARDAWQTAEIRSSSKMAMYAAWGFAAFWNLVSAPLPFLLHDEVVEKQNYAALLGLLFPAVGIGLLVWAIRRTREWRRFGPTPVTLDPFPGAIGGHVGGSIDLGVPYDASANFEVTLSCIKSYRSGSGKDRSRSESASWQETRLAFAEPGSRGTRLRFRFDVPSGERASDIVQKGTYYLWRLNLRAELPGADIDRDYEIPVFPTGERSQSLPEQGLAQAENAQARLDDAAAHAVFRQSFGAGGRTLYYPMGRNLAGWLSGIVIGAAFAVGGWFLGTKEGHWLFAAVFGGVGLLICIASLLKVLGSLRVYMERDELVSEWRVLGIPLRQRRMRRVDVARLYRKSGMKMQSGGRHTVFFSVYGEGRDGDRILLGESFRGQRQADAAMRYLAREFGLPQPASAEALAEDDLDILAADG